jgi:predicted DCC family thiol-disulfide oxidoreductase YuxK
MGEDSLDQPLLVFDGDCAFCKAWAEYLKRGTGERVLYAPYQEVGSRFPRISPAEFTASVKLILPDGEVRSGAQAVFSAFQEMPGRRWMLELYHRVPGAAAISEAAYRVIARHRSLAYRATKQIGRAHV